MKMLSRLGASKIRGIVRINRANHQAFVEIAGKVQSLAAAHAFSLQRDIATRHVGRRTGDAELLLQREVKKPGRNRLHLGDQCRVHAMSSDHEKSDVADSAPDL